MLSAYDLNKKWNEYRNEIRHTTIINCYMLYRTKSM